MDRRHEFSSGRVLTMKLFIVTAALASLLGLTLVQAHSHEIPGTLAVQVGQSIVDLGELKTKFSSRATRGKINRAAALLAKFLELSTATSHTHEHYGHSHNYCVIGGKTFNSSE